MPYFLTYEDASRAVERLRIHHPKIPHLRDCDAALIEAALGQPSMGTADGVFFHPTLHRQAAVLLYHVTKAHACFDGNKRIGVTLMLVFIELNGWKAFFPETEIRAISLFVADSAPAQRDTVLAQLALWIEFRIQRSKPPATGAIQ